MEGIILENVQFDGNLHIPNCILIFKYYLEYSEKTTDLSQVTDKKCCIGYTSPRTGFDLSYFDSQR